MIVRYRWYEIRLPFGFLKLTNLLDSSPLESDSSSGFLILDKSPETAKYRFIWRDTLVSTSFDEDGAPVYQKVSTVNFLDIGIFKAVDKFFLRVENPTRSLRDLMNALESIIGIGFTSKIVIFSGVRLLDSLSGMEKKTLVGLKVGGAVYGKDLVARVEFASKTGIVPDEIAVLRDINYTVESAAYELIYEGVKGQLSVSSNGLVRISGQLSARVLHLIEQGLSELVVDSCS